MKRLLLALALSTACIFPSYAQDAGSSQVSYGPTIGTRWTLPSSNYNGDRQGAPTARTTSGQLTAAMLFTRIITVNQGAGAASAQQLPTAASLDAACTVCIVGASFEFSVINTSTVDAEDASVTTADGWTLVGNMDIPAYSAAGSLNSSALFRARKTGTATWTLYRIG